MMQFHGNDDASNYERKWDFEPNTFIAMTYYNKSGASSPNIGKKLMVELCFCG